MRCCLKSLFHLENHKICFLVLCIGVCVLIVAYAVADKKKLQIPDGILTASCGCTREVQSYVELGIQSTCNDFATLRGKHQKVVAFSFYGDFFKEKLYSDGIEENAKLLKKYYPGWVMRLYHNIHASNEPVYKILCNLQCQFSHLDLCYAGDISGYKNLEAVPAKLLRFLPMADDLVDVFLSRDLDSRFSEREVMAVKEWLDSNLTFHVMRDNPSHKTQILAGMWGARITKRRAWLRELLYQILQKGAQIQSWFWPYSRDQQLLADIVWPHVDGDAIIHDSYKCTLFPSRYTKPWPSRRRNESFNFVGAIIPQNVNPMNVPCPKECRPPEHVDWINC